LNEDEAMDDARIALLKKSLHVPPSITYPSRGKQE